MVVSTCQLHLYQEIYRSSAGFHQSWMSFSVTNSRIAFQIRFRHFRHNRNTKSDSGRWSYRPVNCICTKKYTVHRGSCRFSAGVEASVTWHTGFSQWRPLFVDSRRQIAQSQNRRRMCEIRLTKLSCAAQQEGIVHFYAVTDIKGLSCPLWWMREWRNLLTSTHVGYRSVIRAVASGVSLKFGVQGASATNWLSRVNGARDNGIRLYSPETPNLGQIRRFLEAATLKFDGWPWKTIGHLFYATSSFVHHFVAIGEFKLQLQSGNAQSGSNSTIFKRRATLKFDRWPCKTIGHLFYATSSFIHHFVAIGEFKLELQSGNARPIWVKFDDF